MRPTCSTPIAESLSPTVWRHTVFTGTSCSMVPSRSIRKWEHSPGSSLSSTSGTSRENSSRVAAAVGVTVKCSTIARGSSSALARP